MPTLPIYKMDGSKSGEIQLKDEIFGVEINDGLIHQAVVIQLNNQRQGTVSTKTRSFVRGGGRKPYRQKGTGQARQGSRRSPIWTGGGITFGPLPRQFKITMPKKASRVALKSALTAKVNNGEIKIIDSISIGAPKTKDMVAVLSNLEFYPEKTLIVTEAIDVNVNKSARNIPGVKTMTFNSLNVYDLVNYSNLLLTKEAVSKVEEVLA